MGDAHVGLQARLMSQALRKLTASIFKTQTTVIFINQIREKVGIMFGNPETTPGGHALKFYASVRLEIGRAEQIKEGTVVIGNKTKIKVVKNKVAPPFTVAETVIAYGKGLSKVGDLIGMAVEKEIIKKSGSWYSYREERLGQGQTNVEIFLEEHPEILKQVEEQTKEAYFGNTSEVGPDPDDTPKSDFDETAMF
jgi:recombination protein RecA